nr:MAG TPA: hypothetical protein [Caudoviricetes sp.]
MKSASFFCVTFQPFKSWPFCVANGGKFFFN